MSQNRYYGKRSFMTADLKRQAHEVRQFSDALPRTLRRERDVLRASQTPTGGDPPRERPELSPRSRHHLAWTSRRIA